jgi:hypothetical protein
LGLKKEINKNFNRLCLASAIKIRTPVWKSNGATKWHPNHSKPLKYQFGIQMVRSGILITDNSNSGS